LRSVLALLFALQIQSAASSVGLALWADAADSWKSIRLEGKELRFTAAALGLRVAKELPVLGDIYLDAGAGRGPNRQASFVGANLSGEADVTMIGAGFNRLFVLPNQSPYALGLEGRWYRQRLAGDFDGLMGQRVAMAKVKSTIQASDLELAIHRIFDNHRLALGVGYRHWDLQANAAGTLGDTIRARTEAAFSDSSVLYSLRTVILVFDRPLTLRYEWSQMPADKPVGLSRLTARWKVR